MPDSTSPNMPSKVLVIGSGPIVIGQAAEFDYAGTQACKALREEGVTTVLVNSNPATIMTDPGIADIVYIEPLTVEVIERDDCSRKAGGPAADSWSGQTGLNLAVDLAQAGVLEHHKVRLLGTPLRAIEDAEDRDRFRHLLADMGEPVLPSDCVSTIEGGPPRLGRIGPASRGAPRLHLGGHGRGCSPHRGRV